MSKDMKVRFFRSTIESVLLYGSETWALTKTKLLQSYKPFYPNKKAKVCRACMAKTRKMFTSTAILGT